MRELTRFDSHDAQQGGGGGAASRRDYKKRNQIVVIRTSFSLSLGSNT